MAKRNKEIRCGNRAIKTSLCAKDTFIHRTHIWTQLNGYNNYYLRQPQQQQH